jgi:hypothetical protein
MQLPDHQTPAPANAGIEFTSVATLNGRSRA